MIIKNAHARTERENWIFAERGLFMTRAHRKQKVNFQGKYFRGQVI